MLGGAAASANGLVKECRLDARVPNRASVDRVRSMLYECRVYLLKWSE